MNVTIISISLLAWIFASCKDAGFSSGEPRAPARQPVGTPKTTPAPYSSNPPGSSPNPQMTPGSSPGPTPVSSQPPGTPVIINAQIKFLRGADNAFWRNCIRVQVEGGAETEVGCNKDPLDRTTILPVKAAPACNILRLNLYSNDRFNFSTQNPASIRVGENADTRRIKAFKLIKDGPGLFRFSLNDNGDKDPNDINFTIKRETGDAKFTIENSGLACD